MKEIGEAKGDLEIAYSSLERALNRYRELSRDIETYEDSVISDAFGKLIAHGIVVGATVKFSGAVYRVSGICPKGYVFEADEPARTISQSAVRMVPHLDKFEVVRPNVDGENRE